MFCHVVWFTKLDPHWCTNLEQSCPGFPTANQLATSWLTKNQWQHRRQRNVSLGCHVLFIMWNCVQQYFARSSCSYSQKNSLLCFGVMYMFLTMGQWNPKIVVWFIFEWKEIVVIPQSTSLFHIISSTVHSSFPCIGCWARVWIAEVWTAKRMTL